jgi:hypothetical protein
LPAAVWVGFKSVKKLLQLSRPGWSVTIKPDKMQLSWTGSLVAPPWRQQGSTPSFWVLQRPDAIGTLGG